MVNPREVCPAGKFVVRLDERWCDCGKFQKIHLPCSYVIAACKHAHHDFSMYISLNYRVDVIMKVYDNLLGELRHEEYWPPYQGPQVWPHPTTKRSKRGHPKSSRIRTEMNIKEGRQSKKCSFCRTEGHIRNHYPNNPALRWFTSNHLVYVVLLIVFNKLVLHSIQWYIFSYYLLLLLILHKQKTNNKII